MSIRLVVKDCGLIPAKKNRKRVAGNRIVQDPECKSQMERITQCIMLQLYYMYLEAKRTATSTICKLPSWIASKMPLRDSAKWIRSSEVKIKFVEEDEQGAEIEIKRI